MGIVLLTFNPYLFCLRDSFVGQFSELPRKSNGENFQKFRDLCRRTLFY